jgi:2-iminobutanoate/2-iminopropanoate deaminase
MSVTREVIDGPDVPSGIGPYSAGVRAGDFLYVSGQPGVDPVSARPVGDGFAEQARQAFRNLEAVLRAAVALASSSTRRSSWSTSATSRS